MKTKSIPTSSAKGGKFHTLTSSLGIVSFLLLSPAIVSAQSITLGESTILSNPDNGNGNLLVAQSTTLSQTATIQSLSFYVTTAAGNLRLGIYDATGPSGGPGVKKAETAEITPAIGWNTAPVTSPVSLSVGTYWLAYLPSSNTLAFVKNSDASSSGKWYSFTYGVMPATYSTTPHSTASHWSFYATLSLGPDTTPPILSNGTPSGSIPSTTSATLSLTTNENATCKYSTTAGTNYTSMPTTFSITGGTTHSTTVSGLSSPNSYSYYVRCQDTTGNANTSDYAISFTVAVPDTQAPTIPSNLAASAVSSSQINLSWTASTDNVGVTGYRVERCQGSGCTNFAQIAMPTGTSYSDTALSANTTYRYQVRATDAAGNLSGYSNIASATTQSAPTEGTALGNLAASMAPGTWADLTPSVNGFNGGAILDAPVNGSINEFADKGVWNPITREAWYAGGAHCGGGGSSCPGVEKFIKYTDTTSTWSEVFPRPFTTGHSYQHNAIDPKTGDIYYRNYGSKNVQHFRNGTWSDLPLIPMGSSNCCGALEFFPERNGLLFVDGDWGLWWYQVSSNNWTQIAHTNAGSGGGLPKFTMGQYSNVAVYNPVYKIILFGGGSGSAALYRINESGTIVTETTAPTSVGINATIFTVDPISGDYLLFSNSSIFWKYNPLTQIWTQLPSGQNPPFFTIASDGPALGTVAFPISTYGVVMFTTWSFSNSKVYLYKHASGGTPPPLDTTVPTATVTAPSAGTTVSGTVTISANASDNVGVTNVEFLVDGVVKGSDITSLYSYSWDTTNGGTHACSGAHTHTLVARAYDAAGNIGTSSSVVVNMNNPSYCFTSTKFVIGDRVQISSGPLNVRSTPSTSGTLLGTQATNNLGTVTGGPTTADGYNWWNINFDSGVDGWATEDFLTKVTTTPPPGDFTTRCSAAGVIKCVGFDAPSDISGRWGNVSGIFTGNPGPALDPTVKISGNSSLKFTIPSNSGNDAGAYFTNFTDDLSTLFGEGEEFYIQWRQRFSPEFITNTAIYNNQASWKQAVIGEGDQAGVCNPSFPTTATCPSSCTQLEIVTTNNYDRNIPTMYHSCGGKDGSYEGLYYFNPTTEQIFLQDAVGCLYGSSYSEPPCVRYKPNQWMTFQVHVKIGTWYKNDKNYHRDSTIQLWVASEGQPSKLVIDFSPESGHGYDIANTDMTAPLAKYGKVWLLPYMTGKDATQSHPTAYTWYDELIISRNKIADPGSVVPPPDTTPPTVSITAPASGSTVSGTITVSANASDNVGVAGVQFKVDGSNTGSEDTTAPYTYSLNTTSLSNGVHTITAVASDAAGNTAASAGISVTVNNPVPDTTPPTVTIQSPANNASVSGTVTISGTAADNVALSRVEIQIDGGAFANATGLASWTYNLNTNTLSLGNHTITARATDTSNNMRTVSITVTVVDVQSPTVPANLSASAVSSSQINLSWNASMDNVGVAGYQLYRGGTQIAVITSGTSYQDTGLTAGTAYSYTISAYDGAGNASAQSAAVSATTQSGGGGTTFAQKCAQAGVLNCFDFDDPNDLLYAWQTGTVCDAAMAGKTRYSITGWRAPGEGNAAATIQNGQCVYPEVDASVKNSGSGSLKFTIPSQSGANSSGFFTDHFKRYADASVAYIAPGSPLGNVVYWQFYQRFDPNFLSTRYQCGTDGTEACGGWKQIIWYGNAPNGSSASSIEITHNNGWQRGVPTMYGQIGQDDYGVQDAAGCSYNFNGQNTYPEPPCVRYKSDQWMEFTVRVEVRGSPNAPQSRVQMWVDGQLAIDNPNAKVNWGSSDGDGLGQFQITPYHTRKYSGQVHPAGYTWYDDVIVATQPIAMRSGTPPPSILVGDLNGDRTVNNFDWNIMAGVWFTNDPTADINKDGIVNTADFYFIYTNWGKSS